MGAEHTSVPRWAPELPAADPAARAVALVGFGPTGAPVVAGWRAQVGAGTEVWSRLAERADDAALAARAVAVEHGALDAEIRTAVTGAALKRVFCAHCRTTTERDVPVAAEVECAGCRRRLHVYAHVSRRRGAYLGFMADAEEVA